MDNISDSLRLAEVKKENVRKSIQQVHTQATSILLFSVQWKDLEDHIDSTLESLEKRAQDVELRAKENVETQTALEARAKVVESKENELGLVQQKIEDCGGQLEEKRKELGLVKRCIEECSDELRSREKELTLVKKSVEDCSGDLLLKQEELDSMQKLILKCSEELRCKENEICGVKSSLKQCSCELKLEEEKLGSVQKLIKECIQELQSKKRALEACSGEISVKNEQLRKVQEGLLVSSHKLKRKENALDLMRSLVNEHADDIKLGEEKLKQLQSAMDDSRVELDVKQKELGEIRKLIAEESKELEMKKRHVDSINTLIEENSEELESKEKQYDALKKSVDDCSLELASKEGELGLILKTIKDRSAELHLKEKKLDSLQKNIEHKCRRIQSKEKELESIHETLRTYSDDLELRAQEFNAIGMRIEDYSKELNSKEKQLNSLEDSIDKCSKELKSKKKQLYSMRKSVKECSKDLESINLDLKQNLPSYNPMESSSGSLLLCKAKDGRDLQLLLNDHFKKHKLLCNELVTALQASPCPAKLVIDAMQGFYPSDLMKRVTDFDTGIIRESCIFLLKHFMIAAPQIEPQLRDEAMKLATEWKTKIGVTGENYLEVLGLLQLLASFKLADAFNVDDLGSLLNIVSQKKEVSELCQALGVADRLPGKTDQTADLTVDNAVASFSAHLSFATVKDEKKLPLFQNKHLDEHELSHSEVSAGLKMSLQPAKFVLDVIQKMSLQHWKTRKTGFGEILLKNYIIMLDQVKQASPQITPDLKEEAMKVAVKWKEKLRADADNYLEVLGFLYLLATYDLISSFGGGEIIMFFRIIAQQNQGRELWLAFAEKIPDAIEILIKSKKYLEAVRCIYLFELTNKFSPVVLLKEYMEDMRISFFDSCKKGQNSLEAQMKAKDELVAGLRALIECLADCNVGCELSPEEIAKCIYELINEKAKRKVSCPMTLQQQGRSYPPIVQPHLQSWNNYDTEASTRMHHLLPINKRPRTDVPVVGPSTPQVTNRYVTPSSLQYGLGVDSNAVPTQFGLAGDYQSVAAANWGAAAQFNVVGQQHLYSSWPKHF